MDNKTKTGLALLILGGGGAAIYLATRPSSAQAGTLTMPDGSPLPGGSTYSDTSTNYPPPSGYTSGGGSTDYSQYQTPVDTSQSSGSGSGPLRGDATIQYYQQQLYNQGYDPGPIDGLNGPFTRRAVSDFQRANGLTVDGILGPRTKAALDAASGQAAPVSGWSGSRRRWSAH